MYRSSADSEMTQVVSAFHQRFPVLFTPPFCSLLLQGLKPGTSTATDKDVKEKEDSARITKQRGLLRIVGELELVAVLRKENGKGSTGDVTWSALKELVRALSRTGYLALKLSFFVTANSSRRIEKRSLLWLPLRSHSPNTSAPSTFLTLNTKLKEPRTSRTSLRCKPTLPSQKANSSLAK